MEQLLRILKQLTGTAGILGSIPKPIRVSLMYFGVFVGVMVIFKYAKLDQSTKTFLIIALVLMAIITGGYYAWKAWTQKQQNQQFGGEISQHSSVTPRDLKDPGQRARLDDMRKKFQSGVEAYKSRGTTSCPGTLSSVSRGPVKPKRFVIATSDFRPECRTSFKVSAERST